MIKVRVRSWIWCRYCSRTIFKGELAWNLGRRYYVCKECKEERYGLGEV